MHFHYRAMRNGLHFGLVWLAMQVLAMPNIAQRRQNDNKNNFLRGRVKRGGFEKRVNRGPTLKFDCRPKTQEKQHLGKVAFLLLSPFPRKYSDTNFGEFPPFHPPRGSDRLGLGLLIASDVCRQRPRYCTAGQRFQNLIRGFSKILRALSITFLGGRFPEIPPVLLGIP